MQQSSSVEIFEVAWAIYEISSRSVFHSDQNVYSNTISDKLVKYRTSRGFNAK